MDCSGLTVACVLWQGDFRGRTYSPEWVHRLRAMVARNLPTPHEFVCLSNVPIDGINVIPLQSDLPGWWSKLELFRHDLGKRVLYLDLDTLIVGDLSPLVEVDASFAAMPPSYMLPGGNGRARGGEGVVDRCQTSCMVWDRGAVDYLWEEFERGAIKRFRGDQDYISATARKVEFLPRDCFIKLRHCPEGPPPKARVILSMPWKCEEAARKFEWVRAIWRR